MRQEPSSNRSGLSRTLERASSEVTGQSSSPVQGPLRASTTASTIEVTDAERETAVTSIPAALALWAVTGPMQTTTFGRADRPKDSTNPLTVDEELKQIASALATRRSSFAFGSGRYVE